MGYFNNLIADARGSQPESSDFNPISTGESGVTERTLVRGEGNCQYPLSPVPESQYENTGSNILSKNEQHYGKSNEIQLNAENSNDSEVMQISETAEIYEKNVTTGEKQQIIVNEQNIDNCAVESLNETTSGFDRVSDSKQHYRDDEDTVLFENRSTENSIESPGAGNQGINCSTEGNLNSESVEAKEILAKNDFSIYNEDIEEREWDNEVTQEERNAKSHALEVQTLLHIEDNELKKQEWASELSEAMPYTQSSSFVLKHYDDIQDKRASSGNVVSPGVVVEEAEKPDKTDQHVKSNNILPQVEKYRTEISGEDNSGVKLSRVEQHAETKELVIKDSSPIDDVVRISRPVDGKSQNQLELAVLPETVSLRKSNKVQNHSSSIVESKMQVGDGDFSNEIKTGAALTFETIPCNKNIKTNTAKIADKNLNNRRKNPINVAPEITNARDKVSFEEKPSVTIGRIDVTVVSPAAPAESSQNIAGSPVSLDLSSRHYLRRL